MKKDKWEPCPRCGSNKVDSKGGCFFFVLGLCVLGISVWFLIIPPIGIGGMLLGAALMLIAPFSKGILQCQECHKSWKFPAKKEVEN